MKIKKYWVIEFFIFVVFLIFLLTLIPKNQNYEQEEHIIEYGDNTQEELEIKYDLMLGSIIYELNETKIKTINNKYLSELIVDNKISNREHTIAQELITMYNKNMSIEAKTLSNEIVQPIINKYNNKYEKKMVNLKLYLVSKENNYTFFEQKYLLKDIKNATVLVNDSLEVIPYQYEKYSFTMENGTIETVEIDLITGNGKEKLKEFINIDTYEPKMNFTKLESEFIKSKEKHMFYFYIWN